MSDRVKLTIPGRPIPLERHRTGKGRRAYLPARSKAYRELVQGCWLEAGRPTLGAEPFAASMRFYGAHAGSDLDNLCKAVADSLNGLAYDDDRQLVCIAGAHKLAVDDQGARAEIDLWQVKV
jgi:crossover junction endodeoxyribonuclease RusA